LWRWRAAAPAIANSITKFPKPDKIFGVTWIGPGTTFAAVSAKLAKNLREAGGRPGASYGAPWTTFGTI